jgi:hypothetical protein
VVHFTCAGAVSACACIQLRGHGNTCSLHASVSYQGPPIGQPRQMCLAVAPALAPAGVDSCLVLYLQGRVEAACREGTQALLAVLLVLLLTERMC